MHGLHWNLDGWYGIHLLPFGQENMFFHFSPCWFHWESSTTGKYVVVFPGDKNANGGLPGTPVYFFKRSPMGGVEGEKWARAILLISEEAATYARPSGWTTSISHQPIETLFSDSIPRHEHQERFWCLPLS